MNAQDQYTMAKRQLERCRRRSNILASMVGLLKENELEALVAENAKDRKYWQELADRLEPIVLAMTLHPPLPTSVRRMTPMRIIKGSERSPVYDIDLN